jgi:hypothetical protein
MSRPVLACLMELGYLAYPRVEQGNPKGFFLVLYYFPIPCAIVLATVLIAFITILRRARSSSKGPTETEPSLTATAQVVSLNFTGKTEWDRPVARLLLKVHIPGREPYFAEVKEAVGPDQVDVGVRTGGTVAVAVDSVDPHKVRLEPPYAPPPPTAGQRRSATIWFWVIIIGVTALIVGPMIAGIAHGQLFPF